MGNCFSSFGESKQKQNKGKEIEKVVLWDDDPWVPTGRQQQAARVPPAFTRNAHAERQGFVRPAAGREGGNTATVTAVTGDRADAEPKPAGKTNGKPGESSGGGSAADTGADKDCEKDKRGNNDGPATAQSHTAAAAGGSHAEVKAAATESGASHGSGESD